MAKATSFNPFTITWACIMFDRVPSGKMATLVKNLGFMSMGVKGVYWRHSPSKEEATDVSQKIISSPGVGKYKVQILYVTDKQFGAMKIWYTE